jgi:CubicO group peptidase (beta-lactamase class C family)
MTKVLVPWLLAIVGSGCAAPRSSPGPQPGALDAGRLERALRAEMTATHTPGVAIAIVQHGEVVYAKGFGVTNVETATPVTPDTLFFSASMGKMLTAAMVVSLLAERHVSLDAPIGTLVNGFGPRLASVTMRQLLSHTAGLVNGTRRNLSVGTQR